MVIVMVFTPKTYWKYYDLPNHSFTFSSMLTSYLTLVLIIVMFFTIITVEYRTVQFCSLDKSLESDDE
jgi:hypothetical protein